MQTNFCHCKLSPATHLRPRAFVPIARLHLRQPASLRRRALESFGNRTCKGTQCRSAQPGLDTGTSDSGPQREANWGKTRGPISSEGRDIYWPQSFKEITEDAVKAVLAAVEKGFNRLEVEFPPLPTSDSKLQCSLLQPA